MKIVLLNFFLFCFLPKTFTQVSGKLTTAGGQAISSANVLLLNETGTSLIKAVLTNEEGVYQIQNTVPGRYMLRISSVGYQTWDSGPFELTESKKIKDFGTQSMKTDTKQLGEVIIRAEKPLFQHQLYGTVVNVESSILTKGSSALQVLERSPGVMIDYRNNSIALNGKSGVLVMVNGKTMRLPIEQVVTLLNGMSADDVEKIELFTTPPVGYDAEGSAGMINIVLKKNKRAGTNGSVSLTLGYGWKEKGAGSVNLAHNGKKVDLYGSYTFTHDRSYSYLVGESTQDFPALGGLMEVSFWNTSNPVQNSHDATFGLDSRLDSKTTIGGSITYNGNNNSSLGFNRREFNILPDSQLLFKGDMKGINHWANVLSSFYAEKSMREGEKLNVEINYLYYKSDNSIEVQSSFVNKNGDPAGTNNDTLFSPSQKGLANALIRVGVGKMDYQEQLSKNVKLEAGIKGAYTVSSSLSGINSLVNGEWISRSETSNDIIMREGIGAVYTSLNTQINPLVNLVTGVRYEYAYTNMNNVKTAGGKVNRKLGVLFPGIFLSRKLTVDAELVLSYTKRISRPSYNDLSSFVAYNDPVSVFTGNPLLKPTITNNLKLAYTYRGYSFSLLLSRDNNPIVRYQLTSSPDGNLIYISPQNLIYQDNATLQANVPVKVSSWWNMSYNFAGGLRRFKADFTPSSFEKTYFAYSLNFSELFALPRSFFLEISGLYNSGSYNGTVKSGRFGAVNAGVKKEIKNNGGTFQLSISDVFNTIKYRSYYGTLTREAFDGKSSVVYNPESSRSQVIKLTYSRSFGNKVKPQRNAVPSDERERIRTQ